MAETRRGRVCITSLIFPPDGVSTAQLLGELAEDLVADGWVVSVITTEPHYNVDSAAMSRQPISRRRWRPVGRSDYKGIPVQHIWMPPKGSGVSGRVLQWVWFHVASLILALRRTKDVDIFFTVSPPPTVAAVQRVIRALTGTPYVYAIWELYPDILVRLGIMKEGSAFRVLNSIERGSYQAAAAVTVLTESMSRAAIQKEPSVAEKISVIPTFADTSDLKVLARDVPLRDELGLGSAFVVSYAGNIGVAQDLGILLEMADRFGDGEIQVVFFGDGSARASLETDAKRRGLDNVFFAGHLPYNRVSEIYGLSDVSVVSLCENISAEALPSKVYRILATATPILAIADSEGPLATLVDETSVGVVVRPGDAEGIEEAVRNLIVTNLDAGRMGERGRKLIEEKFERCRVTARYSELLASLIESA